jgi:ATP-grasp domain
MSTPKRPTILLASSTWWAFPAKLAIAFATTGATVNAVCASHHPLHKTSMVSRCFHYSAVRPLKALTRAITLANPVLIVPCDDRTVRHLHALYTSCRLRNSPIADVIELSLGNSGSFDIADGRYDLILLARKMGVRAPEMLQIDKVKDLTAGLAQVGLPAIMKVDGTWGGLGVKVVESAEQAIRTFVDLSRPLSASRVVKRQLFDRDPFTFLPWFHRERPIVSIQSFVPGRPANCTVACWKGEVFAYIGAEVVSANSEFGASTVVRVIEQVEMRRAATSLVKRLGLSGFCGFDFVIDATGIAHLVEMNPRATPLTHLALGPGRDPVAALSSLVIGQAFVSRAAVTNGDVVSFFPQAWLQNPLSDTLRTSFHDVPWEEPDLVRELTKIPWPERGFLTALSRQVRAWLASRAISQKKVRPSVTSPLETSRPTTTTSKQSF